MSLDFRKQRFESPAEPTQEWLGWFREEFSLRLYNLEIEPDPGEPFRLVATTRTLPDLAVSRTLRSRMKALHRGDANEDLSLVIPLTGLVGGHVAGEPYELRPGMAVFGRHAETSAHECATGTKVLSIRLRRSLFEPLIGSSTFGAFAVRPHTQAVRLLLSYVEMLDGEDGIDTAEGRELITAQVHDLAALVFGAHGAAEEIIAQRGKRAGRLAAVKRDIAENLSDPLLSIPAVAARQGVSTRYIHMLFETDGSTFSEYVLDLRLSRARGLLGDPRVSQLPIYDIARQVGFGDLSYFNRSFRRRYGMTPSEMRFGKPT